MKSILRRIEHLEVLIRPEDESGFSRQLRERLESGRRRVAHFQEREGLAPLLSLAQDRPAKPLTLPEILRLGRSQNALVPPRELGGAQ